MKPKLIVTAWFIFISISAVIAQKDTLYVGTLIGADAPILKLSDNSFLVINGTLINNNSRSTDNVHNAGEIRITKNLTSKQKGLFYSSSNAVINNLLHPLGKVTFIGVDTQKIDGRQRVLFNNIDINNNIKLSQSAHVYGNINLIKGNINLGSNNILLFDTVTGGFQFKGNIVGEKTSSRIYGASGKLMAYKVFGTKDTTLGIRLVGDNLGYTQINRSHAPITNVSDTSIRKYFDIIPKQQGQVMVTIEYLDNDLLPGMTGIKEAELKVWSQISANQRFNRMNSTAYPSSNKVQTVNGLTLNTTQTRLTLASGNCKNPPRFDLGKDTAICNHDTIVKKVILQNLQSALTYYYLWSKNGEVLVQDTSQLSISKEGTYKVTVTDSRGCEATDSLKVSLKTRPHIKQFGHSDKFCIGYEIDFSTRFDTVPQDTTFTYLWNFDNGYLSDLKNTTTSYSVNGFKNVRQIIIASNGCDTSISKRIYINKLPEPAFAIKNLGVNLMQFENLTPDTLRQIRWMLYDSINNIVSSTNISCPDCSKYKEPILPGKYSMKLITEDKNGCVDTVSQTFKMRNTYVSFHPSHSNICAGDTVTFQNQSVITDSTGNVSYQWDFGDGSKPFIDSSFSSPMHIYTKAGIYGVSLFVMNIKTGWILSHTDSMHVNALPLINFKETISACNDYLDLTPACTDGVTYTWSDGTSGSSLRVNSDGFYAVTVTDQNQCVNHDNTRVILNSIVKPILGRDTVTCGSYILDAGYDGGKYEWTESAHPDNILSANQLFTVAQSGSYTVKVTDKYGCFGESQISIVVKPTVKVNLGDDVKACDGVNPALDASGNQPANVAYTWSGPGNVNGYRQPVLHANQTGLYKVTVTDPTSNCQTSDSIIVTIYPNPKFTLGPDNYICNKSRFTLSTGLYGSGLTTTWGSSYGYSSQTVDAEVDKPGKYWVKVINTMSCEASDTIELTEKGLNIIPEFLVASDVYTYDTVQFIQIAQPEIIRYSWYFGDGAMDTLKNPRHIYSFPDSFPVKLQVFDGYCSASITKGLKVQPEYLKKKRIINPDQKLRLSMIESAKAYPNPSDGIVNFEIKLSSPADFMIYIFSLKGSLIDVEKVKNQDNYSRVYNLRGLSGGIYILKVITQNDSKAFKLIIQ